MPEGLYLIELDRWKIKNDGTEASQTAKGINEALLWAAKQGNTEVILPKGTYLIDENIPIQPQSYMTFNLGGATLRITNNNQSKYSIVLFQNNRYTRITNGKIVGDRHNHDFSSGGTHEFGVGIELRHDVEYITIDNLEISDTTGDAILGITSFGGIGGNFPKLAGNMESGGINTSTGALTADTNRIRSKVSIPMISQIVNAGYFGLYGDSYGGIGKDITTNTYDVIFYKSDDTFLTSIQDLHFFDEVEIPTDANYAKIVLHQSTVPSTTGNTITIRTPQFPKHIYIEKCNLHHCRRLGIAICGMKHCYVRGCEIHHISGTSPQGAIDIEDGYDINQFIYIDGNNIYNNKSYNIIVVAGKHINITNNKIRDQIFTLNNGVDKAIVVDNHFLHCSTRLTGEIIFANNHLYHTRTLLNGNGKVLVDSCFFHNSPLNFDKQEAYIAQVNNSRFLFDQDFATESSNSGAPLIFSTEPQSITNSTFEGSGQQAFTVVSNRSHDWVLTNVSFLNIKHKENRITPLPPGTYHGCRFINSGRLRENASYDDVSKYEFNHCYFEWESTQLFYMRPEQSIDFFQVHNCYFLNPKDVNPAFFIDGKWGTLRFSQNTFYFPEGDTRYMIDIRPSAVAETIYFTDNIFQSRQGMTSVSADKSPNIPLFFKENILKNAPANLNSNHISAGNMNNTKLQP
ncbi:right-handed parallel beta-helix repeat-containing protein [Bacillus sp. SD088]|uniref:right-handed parallel beta-helix repeat-containing protein n=1 Tax=Bacillus sp. SD088 TaxID=2782012 RepID=UPI001A95B68E|nr:right-handed parallel beta-helix repeat-containing protein [Bacillus sp. SD088]MBO0992548.1 right-handed parallel beta-helix repeat-containing protein [Bacillus sp. SD088]